MGEKLVAKSGMGQIETARLLDGPRTGNVLFDSQFGEACNYAGEWSGIMGLRFLPNDEDVEGGWIVMHQEGTETTWTTLSVVDSLPRDWHSFLSENSYIPEGYKGPEWFQNKMDRIFGPRID